MDERAPAPSVVTKLSGHPNSESLSLEQSTSGELPKYSQYVFPKLSHVGFLDPRDQGDARAARLCVPLILKFCGQWIAKRQ